MTAMRLFLAKLRALLRRDRDAAVLAEELAAHVDMLAADLERDGPRPAGGAPAGASPFRRDGPGGRGRARPARPAVARRDLPRPAAGASVASPEPAVRRDGDALGRRRRRGQHGGLRLPLRLPDSPAALYRRRAARQRDGLGSVPGPGPVGRDPPGTPRRTGPHRARSTRSRPPRSRRSTSTGAGEPRRLRGGRRVDAPVRDARHPAPRRPPLHRRRRAGRDRAGSSSSARASGGRPSAATRASSAGRSRSTAKAYTVIGVLPAWPAWSPWAQLHLPIGSDLLAQPRTGATGSSHASRPGATIDQANRDLEVLSAALAARTIQTTTPASGSSRRACEPTCWTTTGSRCSSCTAWSACCCCSRARTWRRCS